MLDRERLRLHVVRNHRGKMLEQEGRVDDAIALYEANLRDGFEGNGPYDRLAILYRKRGQYGHEARVLLRGIEVFEGEVAAGSGRADLAPKLAKFRSRLNKAEALRASAQQDIPATPHSGPDVELEWIERWDPTTGTFK